MDIRGKIVSINVSEKTGTKKTPTECAEIAEDFGILGDAHAGNKKTELKHRQVSLLTTDSIKKISDMGLDVSPGDFAENLTIEGIEISSLPIGTTLSFEDGVILEVTQIGKECHKRCKIYQAVGDCVMPKEGVFARVITGGSIKKGDIFNIAE
jgi:MOSC domain-containing protein YiiM